MTDVACPNCGSSLVDERDEVDSFAYGVGEPVATITVTIPVMHCRECKEAWTDYRAEEIRDSATLPYRSAR